MTDFKIDYQVRRDNKGQDSVYRVYIPSKYKGWLIMAEKTDTASPRVEALQPDVSVGDNLQTFFFPSSDSVQLSQIKVVKPSEEPQVTTVSNLS